MAKEKLGVWLPSLPSTKVKFNPNINYNNLLNGVRANPGIYWLKQIKSKHKVKPKMWTFLIHHFQNSSNEFSIKLLKQSN